jgi:hypothetical protein
MSDRVKNAIRQWKRRLKELAKDPAYYCAGIEPKHVIDDLALEGGELGLDFWKIGAKLWPKAVLKELKELYKSRPRRIRMDPIRTSRLLDKLAASKSEEALAKAADAALGGEPSEEDENDASAETVIQASVFAFTNGIELAYKAVQNGKPIYRVDPNVMDMNVYFFLGTLKELKAKIAELPNEDDIDEEDIEDEEG